MEYLGIKVENECAEIIFSSKKDSAHQYFGLSLPLIWYSSVIPIEVVR